MTDPLSLVTLAIAAGGGTVDGIASTQLVGAGVTLLQRAAPVVRALSGRRAAILLPPSPALLIALSAATGRGALYINPIATIEPIATLLHQAEVGLVFTWARWVDRLPSDFPFVLLDDAPASARIVTSTLDRVVDLGAHFGLALEGDRDAEGLAEEWLASVDDDNATTRDDDGHSLHSWSHYDVLVAARAHNAAHTVRSSDMHTAIAAHSTVAQLIAAFVAPLLAGGHVHTTSTLRDDL